MTVSILHKPKPFSWSYTHIKNFGTCPRRYNEIDLLKNFKEEKSQALQDGFLVHDAMAKRINDGTPLPPNMPFEKWIGHALSGVDDKAYIKAEVDLAITDKIEPCEYFDKVKPVWLRGKIDVLRIDGDTAHIIDWKTGKINPEKDQLYLNSLCVLAHYPHVRNFIAEFIWLAFPEAKPTTYKFPSSDLDTFWRDNMSRKVELLKDARDTNDFPPTPSRLCKRWCPVTSCQYCGQ